MRFNMNTRSSVHIVSLLYLPALVCIAERVVLPGQFVELYFEIWQRPNRSQWNALSYCDCILSVLFRKLLCFYLFIFFFSLFERTVEKQIPISLCSGVVWKHNWNPLPKRVNIVCEKKKTQTESHGSFVWQQCTLYVYDYQIVLKITTALHGQWYKVAFQF